MIEKEKSTPISQKSNCNCNHYKFICSINLNNSKAFGTNHPDRKMFSFASYSLTSFFQRKEAILVLRVKFR